MTDKILDTRELTTLEVVLRQSVYNSKLNFARSLVKKTTMPVATPSSVSRTRDRKLTTNSYIEYDTRVGGETKCSQGVEILP